MSVGVQGNDQITEEYILGVVEKSSSNVEDLYEFSYVYNKDKVNLEKSNIYKRIKLFSN